MQQTIKIKYKYNIGDRFIDKDRDIEIIDRKYEYEKSIVYGKEILNCVKWYKIKCHICGWDDYWIRQMRINHKQKYKCACCNGRVVVPGINDIATIYPHKVKYFVDPEVVRKYTSGTHQKAYTRCPECGDIRLRFIREVLHEEKYSCTKCGDGFSIPERFVYNVLKSCGIEFIHSLSKTTYSWCQQFIYDFYIPRANMIIEVNGIQHYKNKFFSTVNEQFLNDVVKIKLAQANGIKHYEIIHAQNSSYEYLVNELSNHRLFKILGIDTSQIDFINCFKNITTSLMKTVCEDYNNNPRQSIKELAVKYDVNRQTIRKYLKRGNVIGLCQYNTEDMKKHHANVMKEVGKCHSKHIEIFKDDKSLGIYESTTDLSNKSIEHFGTKLHQSEINKLCRGEIKTYKGYSFRRIDDREYNSRQTEWK